VSELIWEPLQALCESAEQIFIVPDGELALLNFGALPVGENEYLLERPVLLHLLSAERDLLQDTRKPARPQIQWLAMANPEFDRAAASEATAVQVAFRGERSECADFQALRFQPLPVSAQEITDIRKLWSKSASTQLLVGDAASEANFKQLAPKSGTIHLATHGFFLGSQGGASAGPLRGVGGMRPSADAPICHDLNPLLLSGLALAGANARAEREGQAEDGVLTAEEIAALDLSQTEWAVLSACDTGVGDIRSGEGVMGLRRAFQVAGARTVIMSLWSVQEDFARDWMTALYRSRLRDRSSTAEAVRSASREALEQARRTHNAHPFYWAAFVASGDWR
jgi:CHAT domain-containing protein